MGRVPRPRLFEKPRRLDIPAYPNASRGWIRRRLRALARDCQRFAYLAERQDDIEYTGNPYRFAQIDCKARAAHLHLIATGGETAERVVSGRSAVLGLRQSRVDVH